MPTIPSHRSIGQTGHTNDHNMIRSVLISHRSRIESLENAPPGGGQGEKGDPGEPGLSAYQLAVQQGYTGTLQQWLDSLVGEEGPPGQDGTMIVALPYEAPVPAPDAYPHGTILVRKRTA